ncbi:MAG: guanylate kinase [Elusimicrobia bacterium]|nr:guanylate kinase [Elusimicrobiota bacterium]
MLRTLNIPRKNRRGFLVILSAPSGTGKSTICRELIRTRKKLKYSISVTTRPVRLGENPGKHYYFAAPEIFKEKVRRNHFLEWASVHGHSYGTPKAFVERWTRRGYNVLLAIDIQGAKTIRKIYPDAVLIFIRPPSWRSLKERLIKRKDDQDSIFKRLSAAKKELRAAKWYHYIVINDHLKKAVQQIGSILTAEALKTTRVWK